MSIFSSRQLRHLNRNVDDSALYRREKDGRRLTYVAAWYAISEANRIFGHGGWDRETVLVEKVFEKTRFDVTSCAYMAKVRVTVRGQAGAVSREGTGFGHCSHAHLSEAHEKAIKSAETDATKRALATFGPRFGLRLYRPAIEAPPEQVAQSNTLALVAPDGTILSESLSEEGFLSGFRQLAERIQDADGLTKLAKANQAGRQELMTRKSVQPNDQPHSKAFDEIVARRTADIARNVSIEISAKAGDHPALASAQSADSLSVPSPSRLEHRFKVDKSVLPHATNRRIRNKAHLDLVSSKPCLICEEPGCHAHHITFAQPRGLSVKVSDEFTVPLCALHHNQLHQAGSERTWWNSQGIEPLRIAERLWEETLRALLEKSGPA